MGLTPSSFPLYLVFPVEKGRYLNFIMCFICLFMVIVNRMMKYMTCTFFEALNIPVFWPILVMYFIILFTITMKRQIKHMIRYRYVPFTSGKQKFAGKEDTGDFIGQKQPAIPETHHMIKFRYLPFSTGKTKYKG